ncbi:hypothetical protein KXR53_10600 [Inquilinus limosus]|uniref:hypothetical protein n=1 Tax=Inquilinus limosus TaxID=171674 RepID=UPI003F16569F
MVFGGAKISAPAMAAAHGMKDITLHQATNKLVRPLMQHAPGSAQTAASGSAPQPQLAGLAAGGLSSASGGSPLAALTELAPGMLPSIPDLVPFPEVPRAELASLPGQAPEQNAAMPPQGGAGALATQAASAAAFGAGDPPADRTPPEPAGEPAATDAPEDGAEEPSAASPKGPAPLPKV